MRLLRRRQAAAGPHTTVTQVWGPEPIGAAQVDALQMMLSAAVQNPTALGVPIGYGESGQLELTDNKPWNSVQQYSPTPNLGAVPPANQPMQALPSTVMPNGVGFLVPDLGVAGMNTSAPAGQ